MDKNIISKELLSLVLGFEVTKIVDIQNDSDGYEDYEFGTVILFHADGGRHNSKINIHELAHKCKEWCLDVDHDIATISVVSFMKYNNANKAKIKFIKKDTFSSEYCVTELEAIIKATEWVAKEKGLL